MSPPPKVVRRRPDVAAALEAQSRQLLDKGTAEHYVDADLYDFEYQDQHADIDWYLDAVERHRGPGGKRARVLELGAGTGRITLPLAQAGHPVIALDRMATMLASLEAKAKKLKPKLPRERIEVLEADMTAIPLGDASVAMVIAPFNALMHLYTWRDLLACFREVRRVLRPGGAFAFDVLMPDLDWLTWDPDRRHGVTPFVHPSTGQSMCYSTNHTYDHETQVCHIRLYYDLGTRPRPRKAPHQLVHLAHRQIWPEELRALLAAAELELESHDGDFLGLRLQAEVESQVVIARKKDT